jgi:hypothetical protein
MSPRGGKMSFLERGGNKYPFVDQNIDPCDREHRDASTGQLAGRHKTTKGAESKPSANRLSF